MSPSSIAMGKSVTSELDSNDDAEVKDGGVAAKQEKNSSNGIIQAEHNTNTNNVNEEVKGPPPGKDSQKKFVWRLTTGKFRPNPSAELLPGKHPPQYCPVHLFKLYV